VAGGGRITIRDLQAATDRGERWSMLTSYDTLTAGIFEQAGVKALLVGDTSAQVVLGYADTVPVTMDELVPMVAAVVRGTKTALVVADLPFGSYQAGPEAALAAAVRYLKEGGAQAVKLEGAGCSPITPSGCGWRRPVGRPSGSLPPRCIATAAWGRFT
jgi:3-methyl-2-oxobutanoate hydroxymethyltransferase